MEEIKCLIVDDEDLAADVIEELIRRVNFLKLEAKCKNAIEAIGVLKQRKIDLIFLDIQMPGLTGIQFLRNLSNPPSVIITTAYSNYALEGFELEVLDYLLKPIAFERFIKAINKYLTQNSKEDFPTSVQCASSTTKDAFIFVKVNKQMVKVFLDDILYIESLRNYVSVVLKNKLEVKTMSTINNIQEKLPGSNFLRIHRSFIIALDKIESYTTGSVLINKKYLPIGRNYKEIVLSILNQKSIT